MSDATVDALNDIEAINRLNGAGLYVEPAEGTVKLEYAPDGSVWLVTRTRLTVSLSLDSLRSEMSLSRPASQRHFRRADGGTDVRVPGAHIGVGIGIERGR